MLPSFKPGQIVFARKTRNLFVNDVSQYKFYQGFIREKGTINSITKLLNAQFRSSDTNQYNVFEEWAFRTGAYGGRRTQQDIEFGLDNASCSHIFFPLSATGKREVAGQQFRAGFALQPALASLLARAQLRSPGPCLRAALFDQAIHLKSHLVAQTQVGRTRVQPI